MSIDYIVTSRSMTSGTTVRVDPNRLTWGSAETFRLCTDVDLDTAEYWTKKVFWPAHNISRPRPMPECPGCLYETAVAR